MSERPEFNHQQRWRLILGGGEADGIRCQLAKQQLELDHALSALYDQQSTTTKRAGGLGASAPQVARWLGDIRQYFSSDTVRIIQRDAVERLNLHQLLLEPEMLAAVEPDVHLVATLISLAQAIPERTRESARQVVRTVVDQLMERLAMPMRSAISGSLDRASRNIRPRHHQIDWSRTIQVNLRHYQRDYNSIIPQRLVGYGRKQRCQMREIVLCVDQSGSMASSVVYSSIFGAVMASIPAIKTRMIVFDTEVADLTEALNDPVDLLFGAQLGGGTDIARAIRYCQGLITTPTDTTLVLITDLYEGGNQRDLLKRVAGLIDAGVQLITLLALSDDGAPGYSSDMARQFAALGVPCFACSPDQFPDLMATAIQKRDIKQWAADNEIVVTG